MNYVQGNPAYLPDPDWPGKEDRSGGGLRPGAQVAVLVPTPHGVSRHGPHTVLEAGLVGAGGGERVKVATTAGPVWFYDSELEPW